MSDSNKTEVIDPIEDLILYALESKDTAALHETRLCTIGKQKGVDVDVSKFMQFDDMRPSSMYVSGVVSGTDRILGTVPELLMAHPAEILGDQMEHAVFDVASQSFKWFGYRRLRKAPKGVTYVGKAAFWYETHFRLVTAQGQTGYLKRALPIDSKGNALPAFFQKAPLQNKGGETFALCCAASAKEDIHRQGSMLVDVRDAVELRFSTYMGEHKSLFALRDAPLTPTGRRKAIVHWVSEHLRGGGTKVQAHTRGAREISMDGISIRLTPQ